MRRHYEADEAAFPADAYTVDGWGEGVAWRVLGWETEPDEDTEWSGSAVRTGLAVCVMIGDDRHFPVDPKDLTPLEREEYCGECGQVGCCHDGLERA